MSETKSYENDKFSLLIDQFDELITKIKENRSMEEFKAYVLNNMMNDLNYIKDEYNKYKDTINEDDAIYLNEIFYSFGFVLDPNYTYETKNE